MYNVGLQYLTLQVRYLHVDFMLAHEDKLSSWK